MIKKQSDLPVHDKANQAAPNVGALTANREGGQCTPVANKNYTRRYGVVTAGSKTGKLTSTL